MPDPTPGAGPMTREVAELRHALWNLAGTIVAIVDEASDETRRIAVTETSPLVDGARDAIRRFGLSNATAALSSASAPAVTGWQPIETLPDYVTALTIHQCDLYPVAAFRARESDGRAVWMSEVEGPEDDATRPGAYRVLSRPPTHWKDIDWPVDHDTRTCGGCTRPAALGGPNG